MIQQSFNPFVTAMAIIAGLLILGMILRAKVPFFQRFLIPASLIGGILGFFLISFVDIGIENKTFEVMAYHIFNLSFISIALTRREKTTQNDRGFIKRAFWMAIVWTLLMCIQSLIGLGVFSSWKAITGGDFFVGLGFLPGYGFAQGTGPSLAIGTTWEALEGIDIRFAVSVGLTFASVGYLVAMFVGIPLVNRGIKKNLGTYQPAKLSKSFLKGVPQLEEQESAGKQTTYPSNLDALAFHIAVIIGVYGISYLFIQILIPILPSSLEPMAYGYLFLFGLLFAVLTKQIFEALKIGYLLNPPLQRRISGSSVDFLIIPTMMAIEFAAVQQFIIPIIIISALCVVASILVLQYLTKRSTFPYPYERFVTIYGGVMGATANALILLKILDPDFKTSIALEVVYYNIFALLTMTHLVLLIGNIPVGIGVAGMLGIFLGTLFILIIALRFVKWSKEE